MFGQTILIFKLPDDSYAPENETWDMLATILNLLVAFAFIAANVALFFVFMLPVVMAWNKLSNAKSYYTVIG